MFLMFSAAAEEAAFAQLPEMPPTAQDDFAGTMSTAAIEIDVLMNDTPGTAPIDPASVQLQSLPQTGTATVDAATGRIQFTPEPGMNTLEVIQYDVADVNGLISNTASVWISVIHMPPTATPDMTVVNYTQSVVIDVLANDTFGTSPIDESSVAIVSQAVHGTTSVDAQTGEVTYTPDGDFTGLDAFEYTVLDEHGWESNTARVYITVDNMPPMINGFTAIPGSAGYWHFEGTVADEDPESCEIEFGGLIDGHSATPDSSGFFRLTVDLGTGAYGGATAVATDEHGMESPEARTVLLGY
ncbi:MAG: hypothetical protein DWQ34_00080 [Planctomycetota bacterium]|nr:MAG: hypothetical protein DWQ29_11170 [Planctomycetota bacterium]REJ98642.1 MAG: hypothetical protein DWQ34_00080 [Planctomycetota bacterium]REK26365.1 MAG: hypothetical protein DWQ41_10110 [Planctomycetota bacterium]